MMRIFRNKRGQNTAEYAILIALVIAAAMAIQTYVKRGLQAKVRDAVIYYTTDADVSTLGSTQQYEPYYLQSNFDTATTASQTVDEVTGGGFDRNVATDSATRSGTQQATAPVNGG